MICSCFETFIFYINTIILVLSKSHFLKKKCFDTQIHLILDSFLIGCLSLSLCKIKYLVIVDYIINIVKKNYIKILSLNINT